MEREEKARVFFWAVSIYDEEWWRGEKGRLAWGQVLESGGGWRQRRWLLILAGVEKRMWGSQNVLECLEQSGIIEWIWNKKRQTEVLQWKNVHLGRLKKHSIHSDSFTRPGGFLRWHHREKSPTIPFAPLCPTSFIMHNQRGSAVMWANAFLNPFFGGGGVESRFSRIVRHHSTGFQHDANKSFCRILLKKVYWTHWWAT